MTSMYEYDLENSTQGCEGTMSENIQCYFTRRSHLKEQLEAVKDNVKEAEALITTVNGLPILVKRIVLVGRSHMEKCTID